MSLQSELDQFSGTLEYHRWSILFRNFVLTDGAKHLAEKAGAYWLMDLIASYYTKPAVRRETFQVWNLTVKESVGVVVCDDGNGNVLARQKIEYTDFPLSSTKLYCIQGDGVWVIMLPNEY